MINPSLIVEDFIQSQRPNPQNRTRNDPTSVLPAHQMSVSDVVLSWVVPESHAQLMDLYEFDGIVSEIQSTKSGTGLLGLRLQHLQDDDYPLEYGTRKKNLAIASSFMNMARVTRPRFYPRILSRYMIHVSGKKLWLFWPPHEGNLERITHLSPQLDDLEPTAALLSVLEKLEGLEILLVEEPVEFIIPPFTIHAAISLQPSLDCTAYFLHLPDLEEVVENYKYAETWIRNTEREDELLQCVRWLEEDLWCVKEACKNLNNEMPNEFTSTNKLLIDLSRRRVGNLAQNSEKID
jgi:hypothetical protein